MRERALTLQSRVNFLQISWNSSALKQVTKSFFSPELGLLITLSASTQGHHVEFLANWYLNWLLLGENNDFTLWFGSLLLLSSYCFCFLDWCIMPYVGGTAMPWKSSNSWEALCKFSEVMTTNFKLYGVSIRFLPPELTLRFSSFTFPAESAFPKNRSQHNCTRPPAHSWQLYIEYGSRTTKSEWPVLCECVFQFLM